MADESSVESSQKLSTLHIGLFLVFLALSAAQLFSLEKTLLHRDGGTELVSEVALPWILIAGLGSVLWRAVKRKQMDAKTTGFNLMTLGILSFLTYSAIKDFALLTR